MKTRKPVRLTEEQREYINSLPLSYRNVVEKAFKGISPAAGIKAKCLDCCCWQRADAADCGVPDCPLYLYNPYRKRLLKRKLSSV